MLSLWFRFGSLYEFTKHFSCHCQLNQKKVLEQREFCQKMFGLSVCRFGPILLWVRPRMLRRPCLCGGFPFQTSKSPVRLFKIHVQVSANDDAKLMGTFAMCRERERESWVELSWEVLSKFYFNEMNPPNPNPMVFGQAVSI